MPVDFGVYLPSKLPTPTLLSSTPNIADKTTIAILPFVNMSTSAENEYFSDGMTEEIINALAKLDGLKVTSRTSAFYFKGKNIPVPEIGRQLGVSTVLEGSVRLAGNAIRITAQLIDAAEDFHFWSETWDRKLDNIFEVQDEISLLIAEKLREQIGHFEIEEQADARHTEISAYEWYLKSKSNFAKFQKVDILRAVDEIQNAIAIDDKCPFYHASKAIYYGYLGLVKAIPGGEAFTLSKEAALRALELDPTDPEANYAIGMVHYFFEKDLDTAESYLAIALKYRPNYVNALLGGSVMDVVAGNYEQALSRVRKAIELDPLTPSHLYYHASALQRMGRYEEALEVVDKLLKVMPNHTNSYCLKGTILNRLERYEEAIAHYQTVPVSAEKTVVYYAGIGMVYASAGNRAKAEEYLRIYSLEAQNLHLASEENPAVIINIYLGNIDLAFQEIEKDIQAGKYYLNFYREIPAFKLLADDPRSRRFDTMIKSTGHRAAKTSGVNKKALLDDKQIAAYSRQLLDYMATEKPFLDADLSLRKLAQQLGLSPNQLSLVLNAGLDKNFNSFVNYYRVETFKSIAKAPSHAHLTIAGLAYECGFNSKTVFNTYFKQHTGLTPSAFLKD
ncbi:MAG: helix-turn-helix domain-containing protein [Phaeodactylibacter sp.]|nr:helix-turn-helix domain-containing protein [Phaeodactylibacter sp.]